MTVAGGPHRRAVLALGVGGLLAAARPAEAAAWYENDPVSLRARAERKGLLFGTAVGPALDEDRDLRAATVADCTIIVPEYELKWPDVAPESGLYDLRGADRRFAFARDHGMMFRGHTLLWPERLPVWLTPGLSRIAAEDLVAGHIGTLVGRYARRVHSWDVVNEPIDLGPTGRNGLRVSPLLDAIGPGYIDFAFWKAREIDPAARLTLNENGLERRGPGGDAKRAAILALLRRLLASHVPVHALGVQIHVGTEGPEALDGPALERLCHEVAHLGLEVMVTELDVSDQFAPADTEARDAAVAATYRAALEAVLAEPATTVVMTWGLSDRHSWLSAMRPRRDGLPVRPLPYDTAMRRKAAWGAIAAAIDAAPARHPLFQAPKG
ncbi:endo-1,4-beta-xylanase [Nitrospirillum amazonense]|uniref:Beta-xylanase n=1 Tax=Nitrospirillum amazonense TaxID=28077 RepID=A0A560K9P4_9PROT|nr:endo-1,4-beta-xylanase [Nitrospirillum amazonense]TWB80048.1 endo-1,4-beta-xylanase [Nitrospirillum amazonense]